MDTKFLAKNKYFLNFVFKFSKQISKEETFVYKMLSLFFFEKTKYTVLFWLFLVFFLHQDKFYLFY